MAQIIYRPLESQDKHETILDEYVVKTGRKEAVIAYWWNLKQRAKDLGLYIKQGVFNNGNGPVLWFTARTKGGNSIRRYEFDINF